MVWGDGEGFEMKNRNLYILIVCFFILIFLLFYIINSDKNKVCFSEECFNLEIALTQEELSKGLMFRESLDKNSGMLFIFPEENFHSFWMKDALIPLDIIWINSDKEIVFIKENVQPCLEEICETYSGDEKTLYVLELNAGTAEKLELKIGDEIELRLGNY